RAAERGAAGRAVLPAAPEFSHLALTDGSAAPHRIPSLVSGRTRLLLFCSRLVPAFRLFLSLPLGLFLGSASSYFHSLGGARSLRPVSRMVALHGSDSST